MNEVRLCILPRRSPNKLFAPKVILDENATNIPYYLNSFLRVRAYNFYIIHEFDTKSTQN
jgi:hypothetical protein